MRRFMYGLLALGFAACITLPLTAQNIMCPTRPVTDDSNACASTAFVKDVVGSSTYNVTSVTAADTTLTISPNIGAVIAGINLANANTWSSTQTFTVAPVFTDQSGSRTALGLGTAATANTGTSGNTIPFLDGANTWSGLNNWTSTFQIGGNTVTWPGVATTVAALNIEDQALAGGARVTSKSQTAGNITIDCGDRPLQFQTNSGAFTLTAPANDGSCILLSTNDGTAGTITFSGFAVGSNTGDALTTTNGQSFSIHIWRVNGISGYRVAAHQ